jgi:uncharacterized LabA/DUF88 family protein
LDGLFFLDVPNSAHQPQAIAFVDGQNLYRAAKAAFGYTYPNYDVAKLADSMCRAQGWALQRVQFYTGIPHPRRDRFWNTFWNDKAAQMGRNGVAVYLRSLVQRSRDVTCLHCQERFAFTYAEEKGIDVRLAVDVVALAYRGDYDVALIFSQDQDLSEIVPLVQQVARDQRRWIKLASAFPAGNTNTRGIAGTDWLPFDRQTYDRCLDDHDYRPKSA